ncbi:hypothetical protein JMA_10150 [Jeotgalibacillus malaysiensis]|uniref:DUF3953 domain-containing protein n=1 Tax=Jeotgalibacillus malaysiensis TaxID=1508404 RepID=A0A0B5ANW6_9BACL|nr:hypothetical protein [Jeotgalibacillus malaysiensis]AJD90332.1 hypothetical protein JMA_10150 [Jeotgalibacillus malaysiensis]
MLLRRLLAVVAVLVVTAGFYSSNHEPDLFSTLFLGIPLSAFFLMMGLKEWPKEKGKVGAIILFIGAGVILITMIRMSMRYLS